MKAEELRINNLILTTKDSNKDYLITKVSGAIIDYIECEIILATQIRLTEEWLLKFGFTKHGKYGYFYKDDFIIDKNEGFDIFFMCDIDMHVEIKHVHQLQNLYFALTGEELTLNQES